MAFGGSVSESERRLDVLGPDGVQVLLGEGPAFLTVVGVIQIGSFLGEGTPFFSATVLTTDAMR